jgi:hypothetical protein
MPDNVNFIYELEGEVSEIDIFKLAPTLLALGNLLQQSNQLIFPQGREIGVNVKPFRPGSFIVDVSIFAPSHIQQAIDFFTPHSIEQLKTLLECIGLTVGGTSYGVVQAIKFLKGKPAKVEEIAPGEFRYNSHDGNAITVNGPVNTLLSDSTVTQNILNVFVAPMEYAAIDDIKTYIEGDEKSAVTVRRDEIPIIKEFAIPAVLDTGETIKDTLHQGVFLNPKRGSFGDDPRDWSFWRGDEVITATLRDRDFLTRYSRGEIRLNESDLLIVDLLERQRVKGTKVLKPVYEILRVVDYKKGAEQTRLEP